MSFKTLKPRVTDIKLLEAVTPGTIVVIHFAGREMSVLVLKDGKSSDKVVLCEVDKEGEAKEYFVKQLSGYTKVGKFEGRLVGYKVVDGACEIIPKSPFISGANNNAPELSSAKLYALPAMIDADGYVQPMYVFSIGSTTENKVTLMNGSETFLPFGDDFSVIEVEPFAMAEK